MRFMGEKAASKLPDRLIIEYMTARGSQFSADCRVVSRGQPLPLNEEGGAGNARLTAELVSTCVVFSCSKIQAKMEHRFIQSQPLYRAKETKQGNSYFREGRRGSRKFSRRNWELIPSSRVYSEHFLSGMYYMLQFKPDT